MGQSRSKRRVEPRPSAGIVNPPRTLGERPAMPAPERGGAPHTVKTDTRTEREKAKSKGYK